MIQYPELPEWMFSHSGPVKVILEAKLYRNDDPCVGFYDDTCRTIFVNADLSLEAQWPVVFHEQFHAWRDDLRVRNMDEDLEEDLANMFAAARMQEMITLWSSAS